MCERGEKSLSCKSLGAVWVGSGEWRYASVEQEGVGGMG